MAKHSASLEASARAASGCKFAGDYRYFNAPSQLHSTVMHENQGYCECLEKASECWVAESVYHTQHPRFLASDMKRSTIRGVLTDSSEP